MAEPNPSSLAEQKARWEAETLAPLVTRFG